MAKKRKENQLSANRLVVSIIVLCSVSVFLLFARVITSDSTRYVFLIWNLVLAAVPALLAFWLAARVRTYGWLKWEQIVLTAVFLVFLPNSFYLLTDFLHLRETYEVALIYDVTLLASFMFSGLVLGYASIYLVHKELLRRLPENTSLAVVGAIILITSFAIYLGRYTRWNTWDLLLQPAGLLFDVSDRFVNPDVHAETYVTTGIIFLLLSSLYFVIYEAFRMGRHL